MASRRRVIVLESEYVRLSGLWIATIHLAERTFRFEMIAGEEFAFQHDLRFGWDFDVDRFTPDGANAFAEQGAGQF